jgi:hypothetical protein
VQHVAGLEQSGGSGVDHQQQGIHVGARWRGHAVIGAIGAQLDRTGHGIEHRGKLGVLAPRARKSNQRILHVRSLISLVVGICGIGWVTKKTNRTKRHLIARMFS